MYINGSIEIPKLLSELEFNSSFQQLDSWTKVPGKLQDIMFIHGEKRPEIVDLILDEIKYQDLILLFKEDTSMVNTVTKMAKINKQLSKRI